MTKIQQMIDYGIPVIESQCNEELGQYAFSAMTQEQQDLLNKILSGFPVTIEVSENVLIGDGEDEIILTVSGEPNTTLTINSMVGSTSGTIEIPLDEKGKGSQVFSCDTPPTKIILSHGDVSIKVRAL